MSNFKCMWEPDKCRDIRVLKDVPVKKLFNSAKLPSYATQGAGAMDIRLCTEAMGLKEGTEIVIQPGESVTCKCGIAFELPYGTCGLLLNRSGLSNKFHVALVDNVALIDSDYRGDIGFQLRNWGNEPVVIRDGERVVQMAIVPAYLGQIIEVDELSPTRRGEKGYGSTGKE